MAIFSIEASSKRLRNESPFLEPGCPIIPRMLRVVQPETLHGLEGLEGFLNHCPSIFRLWRMIQE